MSRRQAGAGQYRRGGRTSSGPKVSIEDTTPDDPITTEAGDPITTEAADNITTESI